MQLNSKEALKNLYNNLGCVDCNNEKCKWQLNNDCDLWVNQVKQDLDRLEKLEKVIKILKKKRVFISILINSNCVEEYNEILVPKVHLTKK